MLYFSYSLIIYSFLLPLVLSVAGSRCLFFVGGGIWVEDSYIKVSLFESPTPHSICGDIEPRPILRVGRDSRELVGCCWLQVWFDAHLTAYFCEKIGCEI